ncbi:hypothetical protein GCM10009676_35560 [Prauserella halophila]|uniref:Uncharacterized protein n=1 Tax=Prauserella halophila TaxID=185641 RepID=A0ABP4H524_9PSEU|nr:hypothetical protein [Prauserella halophila]
MVVGEVTDRSEGGGQLPAGVADGQRTSPAGYALIGGRCPIGPPGEVARSPQPPLAELLVDDGGPGVGTGVFDSHRSHHAYDGYREPARGDA